MKKIIILLSLSLIYSSTTQMWKSEVASGPGSPVFYFKFISTNDTEGTYQLFKTYTKIDKEIKLEESGIWILIDGEVCLINEKTNLGSCGKVTHSEFNDKLIWKNRETYVFSRYSEDLQLGLNANTLSTEVKGQMKNIVQASEIYKMENDSYPPDCWKTLVEEDYLEIKKSIFNKWEFECSFDEDGEGGTLSATSTEEMGSGPGKEIRYDKETGKYYGYGQIKLSGWTIQDKKKWTEECLNLGIGDKELCSCVLNKLELKYLSLEDMYRKPQKMALTMRTIIMECKK